MKLFFTFLLLFFVLSIPIYSQQAINYGETVTGSISPAGEVDIYIFSGDENEKVIIRLTESSSSPSFLLEPKVELFGPTGSFLILDSDVGQAEINFTLPSTGTYTIFASDSEGDDTGNYGLFIQRMVNPENSIAINYGETLTGTISTFGDIDIYSFSGNAGDKVILRLTENSSSPSFLLEPFAELFDSAGDLLLSDSDNGQAQISFSLPADGSYTILASDSHPGDDTGNYGLFVQRMINPDSATTINYGETLTSTISTDGNVDTYSFSGNAGDKVILRLTENSSSPSFLLEPFVELFDPNGDLLITDSDGGQAQISFTLPADGSYTILASDSYPGDDTGNYGLFIQRMVNPENFVSINYGETITGTISTFGDVDTYSFLGGAGDSVIIRLTEDPSSPSFLLEPFVELFDVSGDLLIAASDNVQAEIGFRIQDVGYYTIFASDFYPGDDTGNYSIFIFGFISSQILALPSLLEFGDVPIGQIANDSFMVFNRGTTLVNIDSININGANPANFSVDPTSFSLEPGDSQFVSVGFAPDTLGNYSAILNISSTSGNTIVSFNGTGIEAVPVELTSFTSTLVNGDVKLEWSTATETNNQVFEVQKRNKESEYQTIGYVPGNGTTTQVQNYTYIDSKVASGNYSYRLKQIDFDGTFEYSSEVSVDITAPLVFALEQNYPNPFNPTTKIKYSVPNVGFVTLKVYDVLGNEIANLVNEEKPAGSYEFNFNATNLSSGIYFYELQAGDFVETKKMILMK